MSFQYCAMRCDSSVVALVPGIKVDVLGRIGKSAFAEAGVISCFEQAPKTIEHARQVGVVTKARAEASRQSRLIRVNLPGMSVDHDRHALFLRALQAEARVYARQEAKIAAAADRHVVPGQTEGGNGKLGHGARWRSKAERSP